MKIGINAKSLSIPLTGIGRYTKELCLHLSHKKHLHLYLYSPSPLLKKNIAGINLNNVTLRHASFHHPLSRLLWGETTLPRWTKRDGVDIFWSPSHRLPYLLSKSIPSIVTIHDLVWMFAPKTMKKSSYFLSKIYVPFTAKKATHIICDSNATLNTLITTYPFIHNKSSMVPCAGNHILRYASSKKINGVNINKPFALFVGTLEPRKNLQRLLEAYAMIPQDYKKRMPLVIAGSQGWGNIQLEILIKKFHISDHITLLGYVDDDSLATLYKNASFLCMPSLYEGFGIPITEAAALKTPCLTANNSALEEVFHHQGISVDALDINSIKVGFIQMSDLHQTFNVTSHYSWENSADALSQLFFRLSGQ